MRNENNDTQSVRKKSRKKIIVIIIVLIICVMLFVYLYKTLSKPITADKPVIYLYPETKTSVKVELKYEGDLFVTYPEYNPDEGWIVTAHPDGKLINSVDGKEYSYLFWEGIHNGYDFKLDKGFVVKGENTAAFLEGKLKEMGLTAKEYNEFIVYWLPRMIKNKYNQIYFAGEEYTEKAKLLIEPKPESILRVFMVFKPLEEKITIKEQEILPFSREGFTVIEWGGTEIR